MTNTSHQLTKLLLISIAILFLTAFLILPLVVVFIEAFAKGWEFFKSSLQDKFVLDSIYLTLITSIIVIPINTIIGFAIAWLTTRFNFKGKFLIIASLDIPLCVSPIVVGIMLVLLFGKDSFIGSKLESLGIEVIYAVPSIILATIFVTFPFIARTLIPLMKFQGSQEEEMALILGANSWQIFFKITLPNVKLALVYGIILTNARAMGEFGAVSIVSGHIRGETLTVPLQVEILYNEYNFTACFALSALLTLSALFTIIIQHLFKKSLIKQ